MKPISFDQIWKHLSGAEALKVTSLKGPQVRWEGFVISRSFEAEEDPALDVIKLQIVCEDGEITSPWFHRCDIAKVTVTDEGVIVIAWDGRKDYVYEIRCYGGGTMNPRNAIIGFSGYAKLQSKYTCKCCEFTRYGTTFSVEITHYTLQDLIELESQPPKASNMPIGWSSYLDGYVCNECNSSEAKP